MFIGAGIRVGSFRASASYSPAALFAASEPGVWYDPSDLTTLFQDTAGTTPVTTSGQSVALVLDKSRGLTLGSELVTNGTFASNVSGWTPFGSALVTWVSGQMRLEANSGNIVSQAIPTVAGRTYRVDWTGVAGTGVPRLQIGTAVPNGSLLGPTDGAGSRTAFFTATSTVAHLQFATSVNTNGLTVFFDNISVRELPGNHATQATAASRPTYQVDSNGKSYLAFDGVDDFLVTPTITPGIDKVQVFAGVRKLSDANSAILAELSANNAGNSGSFYVAAPESSNFAERYSFLGRGTAPQVATHRSIVSTVGAAPDQAVLTATGDIAASNNVLRRNTVAAPAGTASQGMGNYLAYPIYIGRRGGTSLPLNGRIYSLIVRFGANLTNAQITNTETWVNGKTGAY